MSPPNPNHGSGKTFGVPVSGGEQRVYETFDRFRHAVGDQRVADQTPPGGEMRGVRQFDARGDLGGMQGRRGKVHVQRLGRVIFGDRQRPDQIVEVARITLSDRLEVPHAIKHYLGIENRGDKSGFFERVGSSPIQLCIDDNVVVLNPART